MQSSDGHRIHRLESPLHFEFPGGLGPIEAEIPMIGVSRLSFFAFERLQIGEELKVALRLDDAHPTVPAQLRITGPKDERLSVYKDRFVMEAAYLIPNPRDRDRLESWLRRYLAEPAAFFADSSDGDEVPPGSLPSASASLKPPPLSAGRSVPSVLRTPSSRSSQSREPPRSATPAPQPVSPSPTPSVSSRSTPPSAPRPPDAETDLPVPIVASGNPPSLYVRIATLKQLSRCASIVGNDIIWTPGNPGGLEVGSRVLLVAQLPNQSFQQASATVISSRPECIVVAVRGASSSDRSVISELLAAS
jgi:hypothetical protein